jgi:glycosyltransferase involved in cell wall biosynthesis
MLVTSIILTYKRSKNIPKIVEALKRQTVENDIIIWDNGNELDYIQDVTLIKSSRNFVCRPRFLLCGLVQSDYIFNIDDDHIPTDNKLLEMLIDESKLNNDAYFIGWKATMDYNREPKADGKGADLVNTGVSFFPTRLSNSLYMNPYKNDFMEMTEEEYKYADDHWVSKQMPLKKTSLVLDSCVGKLNDFGIGLSRNSFKHIRTRNIITKRYFK